MAETTHKPLGYVIDDFAYTVGARGGVTYAARFEIIHAKSPWKGDNVS